MSSIIQRLCITTRNISYVSKKCPKVVFMNPIRANSNVANILKAQRHNKKESVEVIKWVLLMMPVTTFGLGCWQCYRLQWKLNLIDIMQSKSKSAPVEMPLDFSELDKMEYKPVKVKGQFLHDKEILIGPRALIEATTSHSNSLTSDPKKNQGWLVVTPFQLNETGQTILVNRGWIPQQMRSKEKRQNSFVKGDVELVGLVRLTEKRPPFMMKNKPEKGSWFYRDLEEMSEYLNCSPVWLDARGIPDPPEGWPLPNQTRVTMRNEHLAYLITWFSLSAFTAVMWHRYFVKKLPLI